MSTPVTTPMPKPGDVDRGPGVGDHDLRDVAGYVRAIRSELDDLEPDEIEELTGGLEADLSDALPSEHSAPVAIFGTPADYAAELRSAAGLAPRRRPGHPDALRQRRDQALAGLTGQPWWPEVRDFLVTLRPAWWLLRGYIAYQFIEQGLSGGDELLPHSFVTWLAFAVLLIGSVEVGRRDWAARGRGQYGLILAGNVFAVFLIVPGGGAMGPAVGTYTAPAVHTEVIVEPPPEGLFNAGDPVVNVFPYDKNGQPLTDVQLFDDRGRPLAPAEDGYTGLNDEGVRLVPAVTANGDRSFNVFPLRERLTEAGLDPETGDPIDDPSVGVLRNAALPDPTQPPVITLPVPEAPASPQPTGTR